jgi:hypothetical protein
LEPTAGLDELPEIPVIRKLKVEVFGNYFLAHRQCPYREKQTAPSFMKLGAQFLW